MTSLFISYSRKDIDAARKLTEAFKGQDWDFWIDWEGIPPTVDWWTEIEKGIEQAGVFLFLISPDSARSKVCKQEIQHAVKNGKRLIPLVVREVSGEEVPSELSHLNWIFFRESDDFELAFQKLITAIKTDYAWVQAHRELQVKALDWEKSGHENSFLLFGKELEDAERQLATNTSKEPHPTDLQREYVHRSRRAVDRRRARNAGIATVAVIALAVLAVFGFVQAGLATTNAEKEQAASTLAVSNASTAQAASTLAVSNAATAIANEEEAKKQAKISRAGELAAQSAALQDSNFSLSLLLGIEAFHTADNARTRNVLMENIQYNPQLIKYLYSHDSKIFTMDFSKDGKILTSAGCPEYDPLGNCEGVELIQWNISTEKRTGQLAPIKIASITSMALSSDRNTLAARGWDHITLLNRTTGQPLDASMNEDSEFGGPDNSMAFSPDGKMLASGNSDGTISLWDIMTHEQVGQLLKGNGSSVTSVAFSPDGKTLASGGSNGTIVLWNVEIRKPIPGTLTGHTQAVSSIVFSPDGRTLVSGSCGQYKVDTCKKGEIILWDIKTNQPIGQPLYGHLGQVTSLSFSPDGKTLASGSEDGTVLLWTVIPPQPMAELLEAHTSPVTSMTFSADSKKFASGSSDGMIVWNAENFQVLGQLPLEGGMNSITFSSDGNILAFHNCAEYNDYGCVRSQIILWDVRTNKPLESPFADATNIGLNVAFSPNGKLFASDTEDNTIVLWDLLTGKPIGQPLIGSPDAISGMAFSPNGKMLASISGDNIVLLWDLESHTSIGKPLIGNSGTVSSLAFSPDGKILAMGSGFDILLWDVETHQLMGQPLTGHAFFVDQLTFSPDRRTLASSGSLDSTILLWDVKTRQPAYEPLSGNIGEITSLTFSPDGKTLASGGCTEASEDPCTKGGMILWDLDPVSWVEKNCQRAGRNLTEDEWKQYMPGEEYHKTCEQLPNDPSYYLAIAKKFLLNTQDSHPVQTALDKVEIEMQKDPALEDPTTESFRIVEEEIKAQFSDDFQTHKLGRSNLNLLEQASALSVEIHDANFFNEICWAGGLSGYASQVLTYCQEAVRLEPDNAHFRDSRGLVKALTGDFMGAITDFQFYVDAGLDRDQQRQLWINDLEAGKNPFTIEVLDQLTVE